RGRGDDIDLHRLGAFVRGMDVIDDDREIAAGEMPPRGAGNGLMDLIYDAELIGHVLPLAGRGKHDIPVAAVDALEPAQLFVEASRLLDIARQDVEDDPVGGGHWKTLLVEFCNAPPARGFLSDCRSCSGNR